MSKYYATADSPKEKYINLFTDFGFKRLFGEDPNKGIEDITYLKNEHLGTTSTCKSL